jgi:hypothetical protein
MCDYRRGFELEIGCIDRLQLLTTNNYNIVSNVHTVKITTTYAKSFQSAFTSRLPVTGLNNGDSSTAPTKSSLHKLP